MVSVFLSHSSKDKAFVRELADHLERDGGIRTWLDEREISPGKNIVEEIGIGLDSDFVLLGTVLVSAATCQSHWATYSGL